METETFKIKTQNSNKNKTISQVRRRVRVPKGKKIIGSNILYDKHMKYKIENLMDLL